MARDRCWEWLHTPVVWVLVVSAVGAYLRLHDLTTRSLWFDEAVLFHLANNAFGKVVALNAANNSAPPLFALLVRAVMAAGNSEAVLRSVSCAAGIAAIPLIFLLARHFVSPWLALFPALLVALSPQQIYYSTQLREYSLTFCLAVWLILALYHFMQAPSLQRALHLGATFAIAILTQYGLGLLLIALNLVCIVFLCTTSKALTRDLLLWGVALILGGLAAIGVYFMGLKEQFGSGGFGAAYLSHGYGDGTWQGFLDLLDNTGDILTFAFPAFFFPFLCFLGVLETFRQRESGNWCALGLLVLPFVIVIGAAAVKYYPYLGERQGIFLTPMPYLFAALGVSFLAQVSANLRVFQGLFILLTIGSGLQAALHPPPLPGTSIEHLRPVIAALRSSPPAAHDIVYVYYGAIPAFKYYTQGMTLPWVAGVSSRGNAEQYFRQCDTLLAEDKRVWLIFSHVWADEAQQILQYLQLRRRVTMVREEQGAWLFVVERQG